jgi:hypothetical protein
MRRLPLFLVVVFLSWIFAAPPFADAAEIWKCIGGPGEVLTDNPSSYGVCQRMGLSSQSRRDTDFEKVLAITQNMTAEDVLRIAGEPVQKFTYQCDPGNRPPKLVECTRWVYYYGDFEWQADVTFVSGKVRLVNKSQPPWANVEQASKSPTTKQRGSDSTPPADSPPQQTQRPRGTIEFEQFRLLSVGMSESEVRGVAGEPASTYMLSCDLSVTLGISCPKRWVYNYSDKWVAEVTIAGGRVTEVTNFRLP